MKTSIVAPMAALLSSTARVVAIEAPPVQLVSNQSPSIPVPSSFAGGDHFARKDLRQATSIDNAAIQAAQQVPAITTQWLQTTLTDGAPTWVPVVFTQTFAAVPDQWPPPGIGSIGLGTLTKEKRQEAQPTVYMIPLEMVLQSRHIVAPVQRLQQVEVVQPVTLFSISITTVEAPTTSTPAPSLSPQASRQPIYSIIQSGTVYEGSWRNATRSMVGTASRYQGTASSRMLGTGTAVSRSANMTMSSGFLVSTRSVLFLHDGFPYSTAVANATSASQIAPVNNATDFFSGI